MAGVLKNIIEDITGDLLESFLALRYDICTCKLCKNDMLAYTLSRVPAVYVTTEQGAIFSVAEQAKAENRAIILKVLLNAVEIVGDNPRHQLKEDKEQTFQLLLECLYKERGLDFRQYHRRLLKRRVALRLRANKLESYSDYLRLLINTPEEYDRLFEVLTINVSEFFRDPEIWPKTKELLSKLITAKSKLGSIPIIKIWCAGCANGEEAYSIAILAHELGAQKKGVDVQIFGTDIKQECLRNAQEGRYAKERVNNVSAERIKNYFSTENGTFRINQILKPMLQFQYLDLTTINSLENMDIILCRNVFIYFQRDLQEQLIMKFYKALQVGGHLILGKTETLLWEAKQIFEEVDFESRIYCRTQA